MGATNRPDSLGPALRRAGRFEREIAMGIPDAEARLEILKVLTSGLNLEAGFDLKVLAKNSPGYVGADLSSLCRESAIVAVNRIFKDISLSTTSSSTMPSGIRTLFAKIQHTRDPFCANTAYSRSFSFCVDIGIGKFKLATES